MKIKRKNDSKRCTTCNRNDYLRFKAAKICGYEWRGTSKLWENNNECINDHQKTIFNENNYNKYEKSSENK